MDYWIGNVKYTIEDANTKTILDLLKQILGKGVSIYSSDLDNRLTEAEAKIKDLTYAVNFSGIGSYLENIEMDWWMQLPTSKPVYCFRDGSTGATIDDYSYIILPYEGTHSSRKYLLQFRATADDTALLKPATPINITLPAPYGTLPIYFVELPHTALEQNKTIGTIMEPSPFIVSDTVDNITYDKLGNIGYTAGLTRVADLSLFLPVIYRSSDVGSLKFKILGNKIDMYTNTLEYYPASNNFYFSL